jgi:hypothetical protein
MYNVTNKERIRFQLSYLLDLFPTIVFLFLTDSPIHWFAYSPSPIPHDTTNRIVCRVPLTPSNDWVLFSLLDVNNANRCRVSILLKINAFLLVGLVAGSRSNPFPNTIQNFDRFLARYPQKKIEEPFSINHRASYSRIIMSPDGLAYWHFLGKRIHLRFATWRRGTGLVLLL